MAVLKSTLQLSPLCSFNGFTPLYIYWKDQFQKLDVLYFVKCSVDVSKLILRQGDTKVSLIMRDSVIFVKML